MRKLILFDFDGVLVRSNHCHLKNIRDAFSDANVPISADDEEITSHFGKHYKLIVPKLLQDNHRNAEVEELIGEKIREAFEKDSFSDCFDEIDGLHAYLDGLESKDYVLAIASGNGHVVLEKWLSKLGIKKYFKYIIGADDVKNGKPDSEMILKASRHFNIPPEHIVYVGDTRNDVLMAKNAGSISAVVLSGIIKREEAEELQVDMIASDVTKLDL